MKWCFSQHNCPVLLINLMIYLYQFDHISDDDDFDRETQSYYM